MSLSILILEVFFPDLEHNYMIPNINPAPSRPEHARRNSPNAFAQRGRPPAAPGAARCRAAAAPAARAGAAAARLGAPGARDAFVGRNVDEELPKQAPRNALQERESLPRHTKKRESLPKDTFIKKKGKVYSSGQKGVASLKGRRG